MFIKCKQAHKGAIFAVGMEGKWLFTGGWDKVVNVQVNFVVYCIDSYAITIYCLELFEFLCLLKLTL